jgi:hypothetical protein
MSNIKKQGVPNTTKQRSLEAFYDLLRIAIAFLLLEVRTQIFHQKAAELPRGSPSSPLQLLDQQ